MRLHCFSAITFVIFSALLPFTLPAQASPTVRCLRTTGDDRLLVTDSNTTRCQTWSESVGPSVYPVNIVEGHEFELFNNSYRDILFLHLIPMSAPEEEMVFGGVRKLAPGRAWNVNLDNGCDYHLLVEYEDGEQNFYEAVNTCDYRGIQLR